MIIQAALIIADSEGTLFTPGRLRFSPSSDQDEPGVILEIGSAEQISLRPEESFLDLGEKWLLPGLVQAHVHLNQTLFRGLAENLELLEWLEKRIWPLEAEHDEATIYAASKYAIAEMLLAGCTSLLTMETTQFTSGAFKAAEELGVRAVIGASLMDRNAQHIPPKLIRNGDEALAEISELNATWRKRTNGRLQSCVAPRFVLSCTEKLLLQSKEYAKNNRLIWHSHVSEHKHECQRVFKQTGKNNGEYYASLGLLDASSSLAHGVWLTPSEMESFGAVKTSILHCPSTNLKLGSGVADVFQMVKFGINIALGSDGAPGNNRLDIWEEMRLSGLLASWRNGPKQVSPQEIFRWATIGGAFAAGLGQLIGRLEVGRKADMIALNPYHFHGGLKDASAIYSYFVYGATANEVKDVWVDGNQLVSAGHLLSGDLEEIRREFNSCRKTLLKRSR